MLDCSGSGLCTHSLPRLGSHHDKVLQLQQVLECDNTADSLLEISVSDHSVSHRNE